MGLRGYVIVVLALLVLIDLAACISQAGPPGIATPITPTPSPTTLSTLPPPQDWPTRWLQGIPCRPPCWEGITPGQTTAAEAVEILNRSPFVATVETTTDPWWPEVGVIEWTWVSTGGKGGGARFHSQTLSNTIYAIYPFYLYTSFRLGDVIQAYGEPSHIIALLYHDYHDDSIVYYDLRILYLSWGFMLSDDDGHKGIKPALSADTRLERVSFFVPGEEGLLAALEWAEYPEWLIPWQGMKDFDSYCRDEAGNPCP